MRSTLATLIAVATGATAHQHMPPVKHHPGCNTRRCDHHIDRVWARLHRPRHSQDLPAGASGQLAVASWYEDAGGTACGTHYQQGVANKTLPCGTQLRICYEGRCELAVVEDRGPYVAGRELDLNPGAKAAISCSDLCTVRFTVMR